LNSKDALPIINATKTAQNWSDFKKRDNHARYVIGVAQLSDADGVFIPGLTLEIEIKATIVSPQCLFQFSLRQKKGKLKEVVYQLEVTPQGKRSHNGLVPIYGPHEHVGDDEPRPITDSSVNRENWDGRLDWFLQRVSVSGLQVERPC
jgi:hypothetical protein